MLLTLADGVFEPWSTERKCWRRPESSRTLPREAPLKRVIRSWQPHGSGGGCGEQPSQGAQRSERHQLEAHQPATPRGSRSSAARASSTFTKFIRKTTPGRSCPGRTYFCRPARRGSSRLCSLFSGRWRHVDPEKVRGPTRFERANVGLEDPGERRSACVPADEAPLSCHGTRPASCRAQLSGVADHLTLSLSRAPVTAAPPGTRRRTESR